jgi:hypothetical protein
MKPIKIQRKELEKFIPKEILDGLSDAAISEMTLFRPRPKTINPDSMVVRTKEGKIEVWQVGEERVIASNATLYKELDFLQRFSRPFVDPEIGSVVVGGVAHINGFIKLPPWSP